MAISFWTLGYLISLGHQFKTRPDQTVLELGEAVAVGFELADYLPAISEASGRPLDQLQIELKEARANSTDDLIYIEAQLIYRWLLNKASYQAVDLGGRNSKSWIDLNYPADLGRTFDVVINNGTSEHIFNQANVFKFMHDHTALGGVMIHYVAGLGWVEHGFYNVQPSFFFDLAKYNAYEVLSYVLVNEDVMIPLEVGKINGDQLNQDPRLRNALIHCCLRRCDSSPFRFPVQRPYQPST